MQPPQIFDNDAFGRVRVVSDDTDTPYFVAADVCRVLGYKNIRDSVARHVDEEDVVKRDTLTNGGRQQMLCVNESGVYALIFGSKLPRAREFKRWVTSEVLPAIRRGGAYVPQKAFADLAERVQALERNVRQAVPAMDDDRYQTGRDRGLYMYDYNERCIAIVGDVYKYRKRLRAAGGRFCRFLRREGGGCEPGWVFPATYRDYLLEELADVLTDDDPADRTAERRAERAEFIRNLGEDG